MITKRVIAFFMHLAEAGVSVSTFYDHILDQGFGVETEERAASVFRNFCEDLSRRPYNSNNVDIFDWADFEDAYGVELFLMYVDQHSDWCEYNERRIEEAWAEYCSWVDFESSVPEVRGTGEEPVSDTDGRPSADVSMLSDEVRFTWPDYSFREHVPSNRTATQRRMFYATAILEGESGARTSAHTQLFTDPDNNPF